MKTIVLALVLGVAFAGFLSDANEFTIEAEMGEGDDQFGFYSPGAYQYSGTSLSNGDPIALFAASDVEGTVSEPPLALCFLCCNASEKCCDYFCSGNQNAAGEASSGAPTVEGKSNNA